MTIADNTHPVRHRLRALIVEDDPTDAELIVSELQKNGFEVFWERVETEEQYLARLAGIPEIVLADYSLPQFNGSRALELLQQQGLAIPFVVVSGTVGCATSLESRFVRLTEGRTNLLLAKRTEPRRGENHEIPCSFGAFRVRARAVRFMEMRNRSNWF